MTSRLPVVAILNSNDDVVELLRVAIEQAGLIVVSAHVDAIKRGDASLVEFVNEHAPDVVVYDIVPPYDRSYRFFEHLRHGALRGPRFVLTSTNPRRVEELTGVAADHVYEIIGKPFDIDRIVDAVRQAARARPTRD
ncbi:MAG: hypothetical protein AB7H96_05510 [Vicinamibacterales bacterium]